MDFHIIGVDKNLVQIQVDNLLHLWQVAAVEHLLCLPERCTDGLLVQIILFRPPFLLLNLDIQQLFLPLQLGKLRDQRSTACIGNDIDNVVNLLLHGFQVLAKGANLIFILPFLLLAQFPICPHNIRNPGFIKNCFLYLSQHHFFQRLLPHILVSANPCSMIIAIVAGISTDNFSILASLHGVAAVSVTAETAKHQTSQQIVSFAFLPSVALSAGQNRLHTGKGFVIHDLRHPAGNADLILNGLVQVIIPPPQFILARRTAEHIDAIILFISQHLIQGFLGEGIAQPGTVAHGIQLVQNHIIAAAIGYIPEDHPDGFRLIVIDNISVGLGVNPESVRNPAANVTTIHSRFSHSFHNLAGQILGVVFAHALQHGFQNDAFRAVVHLLQNGQKLHSVLFQLPFVVGAVITVPAESVQLMDNGKVEVPFPGCRDHFQKFRAVIRSRGFCPVTIFMDDYDGIPAAILVHSTELGFNGFFSLVVRGKTGIQNRSGCHSPVS